MTKIVGISGDKEEGTCTRMFRSLKLKYLQIRDGEQLTYIWVDLNLLTYSQKMEISVIVSYL
jgi:hypothetical protein